MTNEESIPLIGITGGIASGKSLVAKYLREKQFHVIDTDKLGHQVYEPHQPSYQHIIDTFGDTIVNSDKTINRKELGNIVFNDPEKLKKLNQISHPLIRQMIRKEAQQFSTSSRKGIVFVEVPLLVENKNAFNYFQIWVVEAKPEIAINRLIKRNNLKESEAKLRLHAQLDNETRRKHADVLIENNGTSEELYEKLDKILAEDPLIKDFSKE